MDYNPVGWFEIPVEDLDRAQTFYEKLLDVKLERHSMGPLEMAWFPMKENAIGAMGTLVKAKTYVPSQEGTMVYFTAPNMDEMLARVEEIGGKIFNPKTDIGEHGYVAHLIDTEGNRVALHTNK